MSLSGRESRKNPPILVPFTVDSGGHQATAIAPGAALRINAVPRRRHSFKQRPHSTQARRARPSRCERSASPLQSLLSIQVNECSIVRIRPNSRYMSLPFFLRPWWLVVVAQAGATSRREASMKTGICIQGGRSAAPPPPSVRLSRPGYGNAAARLFSLLSHLCPVGDPSGPANPSDSVNSSSRRPRERGGRLGGWVQWVAVAT